MDLERRQVMVEIEAGFAVKADAEKELDDTRSRIEQAIESSSPLALKVLKPILYEAKGRRIFQCTNLKLTV